MTGVLLFSPYKIRTFHVSLVSIFAVLTDAMTKKIKVLRVCGDSVAMATIYLVMFGRIVYKYPQCDNT